MTRWVCFTVRHAIHVGNVNTHLTHVAGKCGEAHRIECDPDFVARLASSALATDLCQAASDDSSSEQSSGDEGAGWVRVGEDLEDAKPQGWGTQDIPGLSNL